MLRLNLRIVEMRKYNSICGRMQREEFKPFEDVFEPDSRWRIFEVTHKARVESRKVDIKDFHQRLDLLKLNESVPESIYHHFLTARHLMLYAWFVYRFAPVASQHALIAMEFALKHKIASDVSEFKGQGLKQYFQLARNEQWIRPEGFRMWQMIRHRSQQTGDEWLDGALEGMRELRNSFAHGSSFLHEDGFVFLEFAADFINQLYPEEAK